MSDHLSPATSDAGKPGSGGKPSLFDRLRALFGLGGSIRGDIEDALAETSLEDDISPQERALLKNVLALDEMQVDNVMVPRADIAAVPLQATLAEVLRAFRTAGHSRLPVYGETLDDPRGMVHIRDFVAHLAGAAGAASEAENAPAPLPAEGEREAPGASRAPCALSTALADANILRPVLFVPPSMPALDLLVKMQATRTHLALVIDEYGGTEGLASIEDLVELIVGDIEDEHDWNESPKIETSAEGHFIVDARADLTEVSEAIGADLTAMSDAEEVDTLGGLIVNLAGYVPVRGETITEDGVEFEVLEADPRRVKRVKMRVIGALPPPGQPEDEGVPGKLAREG